MEQEPAAAPAAPTVLILNGPADRVAADYETAIKALKAINVPADNWTPADINAIPITTKLFVKMIKILTSIPDVNLRKDVLMLGFANGFFSQGDGAEKATVTAAALYRFCKWLKTERGATEMKDLHNRRKLARKQNRAERDAPHSEAQIEAVKNQYQARVRSEHMLEFIRVPENRSGK